MLRFSLYSYFINTSYTIENTALRKLSPQQLKISRLLPATRKLYHSQIGKNLISFQPQKCGTLNWASKTGSGKITEKISKNKRQIVGQIVELASDNLAMYFRYSFLFSTKILHVHIYITTRENSRSCCMLT